MYTLTVERKTCSKKQMHMLPDSFYNVAGQSCEKSITVSFQEKKKDKIIIKIIMNRIFPLIQMWMQI